MRTAKIFPDVSNFAQSLPRFGRNILNLVKREFSIPPRRDKRLGKEYTESAFINQSVI
jgi:hypothetical protein